MITWNQNIFKLKNLLCNISAMDSSRKEIGCKSGFNLWNEWTKRISYTDRCIFFIGNGASASIASHFSIDISKNCRIRTRNFADASLLTALANDISYCEVFAEPLTWHMQEGDMLVAISSSGNSPNIVRAIETADKLGGITVTLSAMQANNTIRTMGGLNFYIAAQTYGLAETCHAAILHYWLDRFTEEIARPKSNDLLYLCKVSDKFNKKFQAD